MSALFLRIAVAGLAVAGLAGGLMVLAFVADVAMRSLVPGYDTPAWLDRTVMVLFASAVAVLLVPLAMVAVAMWAAILQGRT